MDILEETPAVRVDQALMIVGHLTRRNTRMTHDGDTVSCTHLNENRRRLLRRRRRLHKSDENLSQGLNRRCSSVLRRRVKNGQSM